MNLGVICRGLNISRQTWYNLIQSENADRTREIVSWIEGIVRDISKSKFAAVMASLADQAARGSPKHQELFLRVNGYLQPDAVNAGVSISFQTFRELSSIPDIPQPGIVESIPQGTQNAPITAGLPQQISTMPRDQVDSLLPFLEETEPLPEEKKTKRNPHGDEYHRRNRFEGEPLV